MEKKINLWVIPTDKPSRLFIWGNKLRLGELVDSPDYFPKLNQHIYITNSEEIKEGDWFLKDGKLIKKNGHIKHYAISEPKIILTTDQDLIKDGVQAIDDESLEWFVENPSCESVEIYSLGIENSDTGESGHYKYEIIIPKQEPKQGTMPEAIKQVISNQLKQETLEEAIEKQYPIIKELEHSVEYVASIAERKLAFMFGAKWQAERMYSEEEVRKAIQETITLMRYKATEFREHEDTVIEQFKKK